MFITINTQQLTDKLRGPVSIIEAKQGMPVLSNVYISVSGGTLRLTGSDLNVEVTSVQPIGSTEDLQTTLNGRKLADIVKSFAGADEVKLNFEENKATISSGRSKFTLTTIKAEEFPLMEKMEEAASAQIEGEKLYTLFNETSFSMATQDARQYLNGLYVQVGEDNKITAVATDGHRLAVAEESVKATTKPFNAIIPRKCILEIKRILMDDKGNKKKLVDFSCSNKKIHFKIGDETVTSKLIDGNYPEYKKVFPDTLPNKLSVGREALKTSLRRMAILTDEQYRGVKLLLGENEIKLVTNNPSQEEGDDLVSCEYSGDALEVGFNINYLIEVLDTLRTDKVGLSFKNSETGCLITGGENPSSPQYIIMPMRV